ncbi:AMP-binding protein, partial [Aeromonas caviae]|uniref:AMP-binding protein n=1 Tax=Aeromonas caviae TaxID=648 RepID=UPI001005A98C
MTMTIKHKAPAVSSLRDAPKGAANLGARLAACLAATPLAPAIRMGGEGISEGGSDEQWLSYGALNARVGEIAARLQGLAVGERVGLYLSRSPDLVASLLACLRLGLTFVPLEPDFPVERLQGIARQARLSAVICDDEAGTPD